MPASFESVNVYRKFGILPYAHATWAWAIIEAAPCVRRSQPLKLRAKRDPLRPPGIRHNRWAWPWHANSLIGINCRLPSPISASDGALWRLILLRQPRKNRISGQLYNWHFHCHAAMQGASESNRVANLLRPDHSARRDSTQLNWLASFCQFLSVLNISVELSWVELSPVVGVSIALDPTQLDEADWLSVMTQFSIQMLLFHC